MEKGHGELPRDESSLDFSPETGQRVEEIRLEDVIPGDRITIETEVGLKYFLQVEGVYFDQQDHFNSTIVASSVRTKDGQEWHWDSPVPAIFDQGRVESKGSFEPKKRRYTNEPKRRVQISDKFSLKTGECFQYADAEGELPKEAYLSPIILDLHFKPDRYLPLQTYDLPPEVDENIEGKEN